MANKNQNIVKRLTAPTPKFFKTVRTVGLCLAAVGGAILTAPIALPTFIVTAAGYLTVAGSVMTAVAQVTVEGE
ncbi:MAG: hypothetical protein AB7S48_15265 [Bacteroidales bacterium]